MKYVITIITVVVAIVVTNHFTTISVEKSYKEYIRTSEELLWEIEEMNEYHGIDWGDTICEGENWCNYCEARESLGLEYFEHYSKR